MVLGSIHDHFFGFKFWFWKKNITIFGVGNISSTHAYNRKKYILVLSEGPTKGLENTKIIAISKYSINSTASKTKFCSSLHYNESKNFVC